MSPMRYLPAIFGSSSSRPSTCAICCAIFRMLKERPLPILKTSPAAAGFFHREAAGAGDGVDAGEIALLPAVLIDGRCFVI